MRINITWAVLSLFAVVTCLGSARGTGQGGSTTGLSTTGFDRSPHELDLSEELEDGGPILSGKYVGDNPLNELKMIAFFKKDWQLGIEYDVTVDCNLHLQINRRNIYPFNMSLDGSVGHHVKFVPLPESMGDAPTPATMDITCDQPVSPDGVSPVTYDGVCAGLEDGVLGISEIQFATPTLTASDHGAKAAFRANYLSKLNKARYSVIGGVKDGLVYKVRYFGHHPLPNPDGNSELQVEPALVDSDKRPRKGIYRAEVQAWRNGRNGNAWAWRRSSGVLTVQ